MFKSEKLDNLLKKTDLSDEELSYMSSCFRRIMFDILHERGTGHWGGSSSACELVTALYFSRLNIRPEDPEWEDRDRFVLSKGHASINLYTILSARGYFPMDDLHGFRKLGDKLQGHPAMLKTKGVDISSGVLGHGLSIGVGMALAQSLSGKNWKTYVLTGEGCLDEGQTWEALMFAAKEKVKNLVLMIDYNKVQLDGTEDDIMPLEPLRDKFRSFGWLVAEEPYDGNSIPDIRSSFRWMDSTPDVPKVVIYDTVKGKDVSFSEGKNTWHGAVIDDEHYETGVRELDRIIREKEAAL